MLLALQKLKVLVELLLDGRRLLRHQIIWISDIHHILESIHRPQEQHPELVETITKLLQLQHCLHHFSVALVFVEVAWCASRSLGLLLLLALAVWFFYCQA